MARTADTAMYEAMALHQQKSDKIVEANTKAITQMSAKLDRLIDGIGAQKESVDRLERAVSALVSGIESQRRTMQDMINHQSEFLKTTNKALDIIDRITSTRAS